MTDAVSRSEPRKAAQEALDEFDNIRWDDIWQRVDDWERLHTGGDLARWSKKYAGYVREALVRAVAEAAAPVERGEAAGQAAAVKALEQVADGPEARWHDEKAPGGGHHNWRCIPVAEAVEQVWHALAATPPSEVK